MMTIMMIIMMGIMMMITMNDKMMMKSYVDLIVYIIINNEFLMFLLL